jgi:ribosomal-protein-alanine N-acetyltransferase
LNVAETARLTIRRLTLADAAFIYELVNQPSWLRFIGDKGVNNLQDAQTYIQSILDVYTKYGFGLYRVEKNSSGEAIGICGLVKRDLHYYHSMKVMVTLLNRPLPYFD